MDASTKILRVGVAALVGLLGLQWLWHAGLAPPKSHLLLPTLTLASAPLLFSLWVAAKSLRRGALIGGIVCLFYFCHGISELWSGGASRWLACAEVALTLIVIGALGFEVRRSRRASAAPASATH
jgi:uncharacterized membrane protein